MIFVTVNTHNPSSSPGNAQLINDHLRATAAHVVDWDAAWQSEDFDTPDNPHPNEIGRQALLGLEDQAIAACSPDPSTTTIPDTTAPDTTAPAVPQP